MTTLKIQHVPGPNEPTEYERGLRDALRVVVKCAEKASRLEIFPGKETPKEYMKCDICQAEFEPFKASYSQKKRWEKFLKQVWQTSPHNMERIIKFGAEVIIKELNKLDTPTEEVKVKIYPNEHVDEFTINSLETPKD